MPFQQTELDIEFSGMLLSGTTVSLNYKALQGADPKDFGYFVALWQGTQIQDLSDAKQTQTIQNNDQAGSLSFDNLEISSVNYIVGLGVNQSDGSKSICATLSIGSSDAPGQPLSGMSSSVSIPFPPGPNNIAAAFKTPLYNTPATNKNWIGLFQGSFTTNMFSGLNVLKTANVTPDTNDGLTSMNGVNLIRFQKYTLVYGLGETSGNPNFQTIVSATEFTA